MNEIKDENQLPKREANGRFVKGQSGNPGGRSACGKTKIQEYCKKYNVDPLEYMVQVLANTKAAQKDRLFCAKELADRLYGKPTQITENVNYEINDRDITVQFIKAADKDK